MTDEGVWSETSVKKQYEADMVADAIRKAMTRAIKKRNDANRQIDAFAAARGHVHGQDHVTLEELAAACELSVEELLESMDEYDVSLPDVATLSGGAAPKKKKVTKKAPAAAKKKAPAAAKKAPVKK